MGLVEYRKKRRFDRTPEPVGKKGSSAAAKTDDLYVIHKHAARRLHYDVRLELDGVLKSWAVPKGPSLDPSVKVLAVHVEDHPIEYASFEGIIPEGEYGSGTVMLWDRGTWQPEGNAQRDYRRGKLTFQLHGEKLRGGWVLVRMAGAAGEGGKNWLLKKLADKYARPADEYNVLEALPHSVATGRIMQEIARQADRVWSSLGENDGLSAKASGNGQPKKLRATRTRSKSPAKSAAQHKVEPASLPGAHRRPMPSTFKPQLAILVKDVPEGDDWIHELKFDGYRLLGMLRGGKLRLLTRHGLDWTDRFPRITAAARDLQINQAILDGEVVVLLPDGTTDFQSLQNLMKRGRDDDVVLFVFDVPYCLGYDLTKSPLIQRKELLKQLLGAVPANSAIRYSDHIVGRGSSVFAKACRHALEGVVSKRIDSPYEQRRTRSWVKVKCLKRQEFVLGGWSDPTGSHEAFGSLLLGYYNGRGELIYCGRVGTGFTSESLRQIKAELDRLQSKESLFANPPRDRDIHWVKPRLVAEVEFTQWTKDGVLRHPTFRGLREDKSPREVTLEKPASLQAGQTDKHSSSTKSRKRMSAKRSSGRSNGSARSDPNQIGGVRLSNPERVLYPEQGLTKRDLAEYYVHVSDWILPHLIHRPLTLVRCPQGRQAKCFYQKHVTESIPEPIRGIDVHEKDGTGVYVAVDDLAGLITLVQLGVLEIHPWGSREDKIEYPDRMIFDFDPGAGVAWERVVDAARDMRARLSEMALESFVRTTGGKGLHIVVPLVRRATWDEVKEFARTLAHDFVRQDPSRYIATASKAKRSGKIYVDYLRNDRGATAVASYSTRARAGAPVATPIRWDELSASLKPESFNVRTLSRRLALLKKDPWQGFFETQQAITKSMLHASNST